MTGGGAARSASSLPGGTQPQCPPVSSDPRPRAQEDREEAWGRPAAGLGSCGAGWTLGSYACCCLWDPGGSTEGPSADSDPLPRLPCPPCRGGRKMPVKKKRKSSGVAAAVAEDGGLKKCKISRYHLPPPLSLSSSAGRPEEKEAGRVSQARPGGRRPLPPTPQLNLRGGRRSPRVCAGPTACSVRALRLPEGPAESPAAVYVPWRVGGRVRTAIALLSPLRP